jgi:hypothetical protein
MYHKKGFSFSLILLVIELLPSALGAQAVQLRGYITAVDSGEPLVGVQVKDTLSGRTVVSDGYGFYSLQLPAAKACISLYYPGYTAEVYCDSFPGGSQRNFSMMLFGRLPLVEVSAPAESRSLNRLFSGVAELPVGVLKSVPHIAGEADLLKALALLPGISLGVEGASGLFIRGGSPDQNLILLDDAPVYNISHFGPLLSVFNMDVVKYARVMKAGQPVQYGGRLSGLVDIRTREGNLRYWSGQIAAGPVMGRLLVEGPIKQDKTAVLLAVRSSWLGLLLGPLSGDEARFRYLMYDLNAKITHHLNDRHKLYLSFYSGSDDSKFEEILADRVSVANLMRYEKFTDIVGVRYGNLTATARYNTFFGDRWSLQGIAYFTRYRYESYRNSLGLFLNGETEREGEANMSFNRDLGGKALLSRFAENFRIDIGTEQVSQFFQPENSFFFNQDSIAFSRSSAAWQHSYFAGCDFFSNRRFGGNAGVRYAFFQTGQKYYSSFEPRLSLRWRLSPHLTLKAAANYGKQFIHLLTGGNGGLSSEVWVGSTEVVPPQRGGQVSGGMAWQSTQGNLEAEVEVFYKEMRDLVEFRALGAGKLLELSEWESLIERGGRGQVHGIEGFLRRTEGRFTGWIAYTLSRNRRRFEQINNSDWFPFRFDRRHDVSIVGQYQTGNGWQFSIAWVYQTGAAVTLPEAQIPASPSGNLPPVLIIGKRNNTRMPAYHRLDIGATRTWTGKKSGNVSILGFSIYNVYNRVNPFYLRVVADAIVRNGEYLGSAKPRVAVAGLYPFIPAVSYGYQFNAKPKDESTK